jgi:hypothetical protein
MVGVPGACALSLWIRVPEYYIESRCRLCTPLRVVQREVGAVAAKMSVTTMPYAAVALGAVAAAHRNSSAACLNAPCEDIALCVRRERCRKIARERGLCPVNPAMRTSALASVLASGF